MQLRGDVYYCDFGEENIEGSEQMGMRPVVIIQNDIGNRFSPTLIVATITSKPKKSLPTHVDIYGYEPYLHSPCTVLLEQIKTISKDRLRNYKTTLSPEDMRRVDKAMLISLGLTSHSKENYYEENANKNFINSRDTSDGYPIYETCGSNTF